MDELKKNLKQAVLDAIKKDGVKMRPRWHFLLLTILAATGALILLLTLMYLFSFAVFVLHDNGAWFAPSFGMRGWYDLLRGIPVYLLILLALFALVLETLVRRYSFAYKRPLLTSLGAILAVVFLGGFVLAQTSLHRSLAFQARHGHLPPPLGMWYGHRAPPRYPDDIYRGVILASTTRGLIVSLDDRGTSTVIITPQTRLPFGEDFAPGDTLIVIGDEDGTDTVRAFGIREIGPDE